MKKRLFFLFVIVQCVSYSQNIQVDSQSFTPQQLIEDVLIDSNCIENIQVTNAIGGDFGGSEESFGYFNATGTTFPFEEGIVSKFQDIQKTPLFSTPERFFQI